MVPEKELPQSDLETGSEGSIEAQRSEPFPLAKQAGVLQDAILGVLPGFELDDAGDQSEEDEQEGEDSPVSIAQLSQGVASLERTVYSTGLLCQVTGTMLRALEKDAAEEANSLSVSFFHSASRLQEVIDFFDQVDAQNPQADLPPSNYERFVQYLKEAQEKLDLLEGPELPKQADYTPAFFAKRHNRTPTSIRNQMEQWGTRRGNPTALKKEGRWIISNYEVAKQFDRWLCTVRREKSSSSL